MAIHPIEGYRNKSIDLYKIWHSYNLLISLQKSRYMANSNYHYIVARLHKQTLYLGKCGKLIGWRKVSQLGDLRYYGYGR